MKTIKLASAIAVASVSVTAAAQHTDGLAGLGSGTAASIDGSVPVAIVAECETLAAFQVLTGMDAACIGSTGKACAPSISSAELRQILTGATAGSIGGVGGTLQSILGTAVPAVCATTSANQGGALIKNYAADGTINAIDQFLGSAASARSSAGVGGCGPNGSASLAGGSDAASVQAGLDGNKVPMGYIAATDLSLMDASVGFIKLDGVAPDLAHHLSGNYSLVANITGGSPAVADFVRGGSTIGAASVADGDAVAYHSQLRGGSPTACGFLGTTDVADANGGAL